MSAQEFLPARRRLEDLALAAAGCRGCLLYRQATQTVFGEGLERAQLFLVGEQPGDQEDLQGHPFVGPAGKVLDGLLEQAGIERDKAYLTNVVKHFKWQAKGKKRLHQKPAAGEVAACLPWLEAELKAVRPRLMVLLGATAAQALLGRTFKVSLEHGKLRDFRGTPCLATVHPSSVLRQRTAQERQQQRDLLLGDLRLAADYLSTGCNR